MLITYNYFRKIKNKIYLLKGKHDDFWIDKDTYQYKIEHKI